MALAKVGDLVRHIDDGSTWLSRITDIDSNRFLSITDEYIIKNCCKHELSWTGIGDKDIIENYGNITLDEWFELFPEYKV